MQKYLTLLLIFSVVFGTPVFANSLVDDIASKQSEVNDLQAKYNEYDSNATALQNAADDLKDAIAPAKATMDAAKTAYDNTPDNPANEKNAAKKTWEDAVKAHTEAQTAATNKQNDATAERNKANAELTKLNQAKSELSALKAILDSEPFKFLDEFDKFAAANNEFDTDETQTRKNVEDEANKYADMETKPTIQADMIGKADDYFTKVNNKFDAMQGTFDANSNKAGIDNVEKQYEQQLGEFFRYYVKDMVTQPLDPDTGELKYHFDDYLVDLDEINESFTVDVNNLGIDNSQGDENVRIIDPRKALDKTVSPMGSGAVKIDLGWVGVGNWATSNLGTSLYDVVSKMDNVYNDQALQDNAKWFRDSWQSLESAEMDIPVKDVAAAYGGMGSNTSYVVNAYGQLVTDSDELAQYKSDLGDTGENLSTYYRNERFNNRSYGYQYQNGTANVAAVTVGKKKYVLQHTVFTSPIVLDMDGDGRIEASNGEWKPMPDRKMGTGRVVEFDLNGDGFLELVEWVGANDGLLVQYTEGEITGHNLFGEAGGWVTGYEKMMLFDANKDMILSGAELSTLSVWQDKDGNAQVDQGEITTLKEAGIESLNITHNNLQSSFTQNGAQKTMWDWYPVTLQVKRSE